MNRQARAAGDAIYSAGLASPSWFAGLTHSVANLIGVHATLFALAAGLI